MILQKIELNNFMCYSGYNVFEFTEGLNVVIGDNGYGKSKLYDGFYWVMYDRCFDTRRKEFYPTSSLKKSLTSDMAIHLAEDGIITTSVILTFHHTEKNSIYILERRYHVKKSGTTIVEDRESQEVVMVKDLAYLNARQVTDPIQISIIKKAILPDNIKPYMWFQGEQIEAIIDFNKENTLTQAINVLSNISKYDNLIELANNLKTSSTREYQKKQRELSGDKAKSEALERERSEIETRINELEILDIQLKDSLATAEERAERLLSKLADAQKIRDLQNKRDILVQNLQDAQDDFEDEQIGLHKRMFTNKWIIKGTENIFEEYSELYNNFEQKKITKKAVDNAERELNKKIFELPIDVPEPIHIQNMLTMERCLVCDREAKKDTAPWNYMKTLLARSKAKVSDGVEEEQPLHDFSEDLKKLYHNGLALKHRIPNIDDDIKSVFIKIASLDKKRRNLSQECQKIESDINDMIISASINIVEATNILNEYATQNDLTKRFGREVENNERLIATKKQALAVVEEKIANLVTGEMPTYLEEKLEVLNDFKLVADSTRKRVFNGLVNILENEANKHYQEMMQGNLATKGIIKFRQLSNEKNYMPELVDDQGNVLLQLNTGNIILIKLATIMAIISAKQGSATTDLYTLITDAPTSVFGEDYTVGFCKTVSHVYKQSIIMSKEFYKNVSLRNTLLTDSEIKLGKVFMITPSIPETERSNRNELTTKITPLN